MSEHRLAIFLLASLLPLSAHADERRKIALADALAAADANLPALRGAEADVAVSVAQADEQRSPLLPQLSGTAVYRRATSNFVSSPGAVPGSVDTTAISSSGRTKNYFNFAATLSQTLFDAPSFSRWRAALASVGAQRALAAAIRLDAAYNVRLSFFGARANQALMLVARETLANQKRHLEQVRGFVEVGTRPEIDLAQSRTDVANAQVALINAENNYATSKAQLNQAMGVAQDTEYDLGEGTAEPIDLEDSRIDDQVDAADRTRPELKAFDERLRAEALVLRANKWGYAPQLGLSTTATYAGQQLDNMAWNWNIQAGLSWNLFSGLLTYSQVKEAEAQLVSLRAQRDTERLQVRLELERGRLAVRAAKATVAASGDALENARLREKLAEGRYQAGVGSSIELSDAELALANAGAQKVQADFNVGSARAQLLRALGRR